MELYSLKFLLFLVTSLAAYFGVGRLFGRGQWIVLLGSSFWFYYLMGSWRTLAYVAFAAVVTWGAALALAQLDAKAKAARKAASSKDEKKAIKARAAVHKRLVLLAALLACFGLLAYLKYWNVILFQLGRTDGPRSMGLLLPLGISFYTFQSVGYLVDAYNGKIKPEKNLARHLLFVTYFPQMIQGPINRSAELAPQLFARHTMSDVSWSHALLTCGYGMLKKFVMADLLVDIIGSFLGAARDASSGALYVAAILMYSIQQYGDFSGGIDMVEGYSELFGIKMARNFRRPYFSVSLADFWRRWHVSLGQWMRDYVFYPVALTKPMKRLGKWAQTRLGRHVGRTLPACLANILVFLLVGVWHGAEYHFLAWGLYNGLVIALSDLLAPVYDRMAEALHVDRETALWRVCSVVRTFVVVNIGWYFDRIEDFGQSLYGLALTFTNPNAAALAATFDGLRNARKIQIVLALVAAAVVFVVSLWEERSDLVAKRAGAIEGPEALSAVLSAPFVARICFYALLWLLVMFSFVMDVGGGFMYANY